MRLVPILAIFCIIGSILFCHVSASTKANAEPKTEEVDEESYDDGWVEPPIPEFVKNYLDSSDWSIDTICVVNGKAFYFASDIFSRTNIIYDEDKIYADNPTLYYDSLETKEPYKFMVHTAVKSLTVDFTDKQSLAGMSAFNEGEKDTKCYKKDFFAPFGRNVVYRFEMDFQDVRTKHSTEINSWLVSVVNKSLSTDANLPEATAMYIGYSKNNYSDWKYKGNVNDFEGIAKFASDKYFALKHIEYGDSVEDYPYALYFDLSVKKIFENKNIVSYLKYTHDYEGGAHGYYTEFFISFDKVNKQEIDWDYLFKPDCRKRVMAIFYEVVKNDKHYQQFENTASIKGIREHFELNLDAGLCDGEVVIPQPGISKDGVVFSFQPYAISCFAAGVFHFTVPYKSLMPYLTDKAKRQIALSLP